MGEVKQFPVVGESFDAISRRLEVLEKCHGGGGGNMEARIAKLESSVEYIQRDISDIKTDIRVIRTDAKEDFRILFGALITVALGLGGLMAKGFNWF